MERAKPVLLLILDGWGQGEPEPSNAIENADTPNWDRLRSEHAHNLINTSGERVGLPGGQMGNSEVGHMNLGAGRVVFQDFSRITNSIADGTFFQNPALAGAARAAAEGNGRIHLMGLLSEGGVHSHEAHFFAAIDLCKQYQVPEVYLHLFTDGRDTPPRSALESLQRLNAHIEKAGTGSIASVSGRYFAMDRDNRWERVKLVYDCIVLGETKCRAATAEELVQQAYERDESDEFVPPSLVEGPGEQGLIADGDTVIFVNFRADRARQISRVFTEESFSEFECKNKPTLADFVCMTEYHAGINASVAFPPLRLSMILGEYLSSLNMKQLRIAETEKYAHVTFFFNCGREEPFPGESRELIPSPKVATYDLQPQMSLPELSEKLCAAIESQDYDLIVCNIANPDMVGHSGNYEAALKAVVAVDKALGEITSALNKVGGLMLLTADHGNIEKMSDPETGQAHTAHTTNPVPLVYTGPQTLRDGGALEDIAPTILDIMNLPLPDEMTGVSLLVKT